MQVEFRTDDPDPAAVADVRHWMQRATEPWGLDDEVLATLTLIASELVTNSVRHARTAFVVTVEVHDGKVRVEVFDRDTRLPVAVAADEEATSGRGLMIVSALSENWGAQTGELEGISGKTIWAELPA